MTPEKIKPSLELRRLLQRTWPRLVGVLAIPTTAENKDAAEELINFALEPEIQKEFVLNGITYAPSNSKILLTDEQTAMLGASEEMLARTTFIDPIYNLANIDKWNELTNRVKA